MRHASSGRPSWSPDTGEESAGLPLLGECHCCWSVLEVSPSATARRARHHCQHRAHVAAWGNSVRSGMLASEPRTLRERSEPGLSAGGGSSEGDGPLARAWAGVRPGSQSFPLAPCFSERHLSNGKLFKARVSRGLLPFGAGGWGRRESPAAWEQRQPSAVGGAALPFWLGHPPSGWPWGRRLRCPAQWPEVAGDLVEPRVPLDGVGQVLHAEVNRTQRDALTVRVGAEVVQGARLAALAVLAD